MTFFRQYTLKTHLPVLVVTSTTTQYYRDDLIIFRGHHTADKKAKRWQIYLAKWQEQHKEISCLFQQPAQIPEQKFVPIFEGELNCLFLKSDLDVSCREGVKTRVVVMSHFVKPKCVPTPFFQFQSIPTVFVVRSLGLSHLKFEKTIT